MNTLPSLFLQQQVMLYKHGIRDKAQHRLKNSVLVLDAELCWDSQQKYICDGLVEFMVAYELRFIEMLWRSRSIVLGRILVVFIGLLIVSILAAVLAKTHIVVIKGLMGTYMEKMCYV
jgi:hypothetical protein